MSVVIFIESLDVYENTDQVRPFSLRPSNKEPMGPYYNNDEVDEFNVNIQIDRRRLFFLNDVQYWIVWEEHRHRNRQMVVRVEKVHH